MAGVCPLADELAAMLPRRRRGPLTKSMKSIGYSQHLILPHTKAHANAVLLVDFIGFFFEVDIGHFQAFSGVQDESNFGFVALEGTKLC